MSGCNDCRGRERDLLVADTSGLYALFDAADPRHEAVSRVVRAERGPFHVSPFVLQELDYLVAERIGGAHAVSVMESVASGAYRLEPFDHNDLALAAVTMRRHADMKIGLADASIIVIAARYVTDRILTLDERHFRALRPLQGGAFTILPTDAS